MTVESPSQAVARARRREPRGWKRRKGDAIVCLAALALMTAPTQIWAITVVGGHGVTLGIVVGICLACVGALSIGQLRGRLGATLAVAACAIAWGFLAAIGYQGFWSERTTRHGALLLLCYFALLGAATSNVSWRQLAKVLRGVGAVYVICVAYGVYQVFARRLGWPGAFLEVTNPSLSTDWETVGLQPGAFGVGTGSVYLSRASSFFVEPTNFGFFLAYGLAVSLAMVMGTKVESRWGTAGIVLVSLGLAANQSLTGLLACGSVVVMYFVISLLGAQVRRVVRVGAMIVVAAGGVLALLPGAVEGVEGRLQVLSIEESSGRFSALPEAMDSFRRHAFGTGVGGHVDLGVPVHSGLLILIVNLGVVGVLVPVVWLVIIASLVRRAARVARLDCGREAAVLALGALFLTVHLALWSSSGTIYDPYPWALSGFSLAIWGSSERGMRKAVSR